MGIETSKLPQDDLNDLRKNTGFTCEEIFQWYEKFIKEHPNGSVSFKEFKKIYKSIYPEGNASKFAGHVFRTFDDNSDGFLDFREFLSSIYTTSYGRIDQKLRVTFTMYDVDGNGLITWPEFFEVFLSVHTAMGNVHSEEDEAEVQKRASKFYKMLDLRACGEVTFDNFMEAVMSNREILKFLRSKPLLLH